MSSHQSAINCHHSSPYGTHFSLPKRAISDTPFSKPKSTGLKYNPLPQLSAISKIMANRSRTATMLMFTLFLQIHGDNDLFWEEGRGDILVTSCPPWGDTLTPVKFRKSQKMGQMQHYDMAVSYGFVCLFFQVLNHFDELIMSWLTAFVFNKRNERKCHGG